MGSSEESRPRGSPGPRQDLEKQPKGRVEECRDATPRRIGSRGWELEPLLLSLSFASLCFKGILYLTEAVLLMLILHANTAGLLTQLFVSVEGELL